KLLQIGGKAVEGAFFSNHYSAEDKSPHVQSFIERYRKDYKEIPSGLAAMGYDATMVLADAMKRAKTLSPQDIRAALAATKDFQGVTGRISIDQQRNAVKPAVVLKVLNGNFVYESTIRPG
ncbi:MAG: hypothetical protein RIQ81_1529, partial [Pseudomonadota bacterium]